MGGSGAHQLNSEGRADLETDPRMTLEKPERPRAPTMTVEAFSASASLHISSLMMEGLPTNVLRKKVHDL